MSFCSKFYFEKPNVYEAMCVCVCVILSVASCISETSEAIAIKFDLVTASVTGMHHMLIIFTLTFIQVHKDLNHETNKCSTVSETV